jgi:transposase
VEGTGAYGAGLARFLGAAGVKVIEIDRPNRQARRSHGKSDTVDAIEAARAALSGRAKGVAKTADGNVEAIRVLLVAHNSGRDTRTACLNQLRHLGFTAPDELRERLRDVPVWSLAERAANLRPNRNSDPVLSATKLAMQTLGRRVIDIDADCARLHGELAELVHNAAPSLVALYGVGTLTAAWLLVAAGDNADRITSEAAFAHLCGAAPIEASSGKTIRHRFEPRRQPARQPGAVADRDDPHATRSAHPRLRRTPHDRRSQQARDHACPQALRRPRGLPPPPTQLAPRTRGGSDPAWARRLRLSWERSVGPPRHHLSRHRVA